MFDDAGAVLVDAILPRHGGQAFRLDRGLRLRILDVHGGHVPNLVCLGDGGVGAKLSMATTRLMTARWNLTPGMTLYSSHAQPMLTVIADTVGRHHLEGGYCTEPGNVARLGEAARGPNCYDTFVTALAPFAVGAEHVEPDMCIALFQRYTDAPDGRRTRAAASAPGGMIEFEADADLVVAVSDCPQLDAIGNGGGHASVRVCVTRSR